MGILVADHSSAPQPEPWSWTVAELGKHLTPTQVQTLLARFRALGYNVKEWV